MNLAGSRKRARTEDEKKQRKDALLRSAIELFNEKGYQASTVEMITSRAGLSTGTFYLYYKNKVEIFKDIQKQGLDILTEMIDEALSWPGKDALAQLSEVARTYHRFYQEHRLYFDIMAILSASPTELKERQSQVGTTIDHNTSELLKRIENIIRDGVDRGELRSIDTWKTTSIFWGLMDGLLLLDERDNLPNVIGESLDDLIKTSLEMFFFGIAQRVK